jgi:lysophospholipase L1-like esterase
LAIVYIPFRRDIPDLSKASESILKDWCEAHQVGMFDLTSAEAPYTAKEITLDNGVHLNAKGHGVIAKALEQSWLEVAEK